MLQQKQPTSITPQQLKQQATQFLLKVTQWVLDKNQCFRGLSWYKMRLPPKHPMWQSNTNLITFATRQCFPTALVKQLSTQLCEELRIDTNLISHPALNLLPKNIKQVPFEIPDMETLLHQPQVLAWLNQQNQPPAQAQSIHNAQSITTPPTQLRNRSKKITAQESVPSIQEVREPQEETGPEIKKKGTVQLSNAKKKKPSEKRTPETPQTHPSEQRSTTTPHHPTMDGARFRHFSAPTNLPSNASSQQETWETNKEQVKQLLALGNSLLPIQVDLLNHFPYWQTLQDKNTCQQFQQSYHRHQAIFNQQTAEPENKINVNRLNALAALQ